MCICELSAEVRWSHSSGQYRNRVNISIFNRLDMQFHCILFVKYFFILKCFVKMLYLKTTPPKKNHSMYLFLKTEYGFI